MKLPQTQDYERTNYEHAVSVDGEIVGQYTSEKGRKRVLARARQAYPRADIRCVTRSVIRTEWSDGDADTH